MITDAPTQPTIAAARPEPEAPRTKVAHLLLWPRILFCLLLACVGASWFVYQLALAPQPANFMPHWRGAQWIQAADGNAPLAYFRYVYQLNTFPDGAFITLAADQSFEVYVNNAFVATNAPDVAQGKGQRAYMYDILANLQPGPNVIAISVANLDQRVPSLQASVGLIQGQQIAYYGSGANWQATAQSIRANLRYAVGGGQRWTAAGFDATAWQSARKAATPGHPPLLTTNPALYGQPLPLHWMNAGSGHEAYFVRTVDLSSQPSGSWLRIVATGPASIFINGNLITTWNGQVSILQQEIVNYLSDAAVTPRYQNGMVLGVYDITPYLHAGTNTVAIHVLAPGNTTLQAGLETLNTALLVDLLSSDGQDHDHWVRDTTGWHASNHEVDGWMQGSKAALSWPAPFAIGRPGMIRATYLPESNNIRNASVFPLLACLLIVLFCTLAVCGFWLLMALVVMRRYYRSRTQALVMLSLAYLPALACEALLFVLGREPQVPQPFPYTWPWGLVLLTLVALGYLMFGLTAYYNNVLPVLRRRSLYEDAILIEAHAVALSSKAQDQPKLEAKEMPSPLFRDRLLIWLNLHWGLLLLMLVAMALISYSLSYEPYWQDELTSYFAAKGIMATGLPVMPSGFLYPKGELYSYLLALSIFIFGDQGGNLRLVSIAAYLISLPLCYGVGSYFFDRKVALLATVTLAFSPFTMQWGRAVRMYELAQMFTIIVMYLFYKALQERERPHLIYLAVGALLLDYLSHEEIFIILPALLICVLLISRDASHRLPAVLYQKHWWIASLLGAAVIGLQLAIAKISHPPILGTDQSQQPMIQLTLENLPYYFKMLFFPGVLSYTQPLITVNSLLALIGCVWALRSGDQRARYCTLFLIISIVTLVVIFTATADRYIYPLLPVYYLLGASALLAGLRVLWRPVAARAASIPGHTSKALRFLALSTIFLTCICVVLIPIVPIGSYSLFLSKQAGLPYHRHYPDYDDAATYVHSHWQQGDVVISVSPAISILYYVGRVDYFFSMDRALYLFEKRTGITDTPTGSQPLLSQDDFNAVLGTHARIWVITDNGSYRSAIKKNKRFIFPPDFRIVYRGSGSIVYLRGG